MDPTCSYPCYRKHSETSSPIVKKKEKIQLVFFDMDGVLIDAISSWRHIHERFGTSNQRSVTDYLQGKIDYTEFMRRDVALWKEHGKLAKQETIVKILMELPMIKGAKECITFLKQHDIKTAIVSAGLDLLAEKVAKDLGIDYVFANSVTINDDGRLNGDGVLHVELTQKDKNVRDLAEKLFIPVEACAAVGNSCFDIPMFEACGMGIAFNPVDDCVRSSADLVVEGKDLARLIPALKSYV